MRMPVVQRHSVLLAVRELVIDSIRTSLVQVIHFLCPFRGARD